MVYRQTLKWIVVRTNKLDQWNKKKWKIFQRSRNGNIIKHIMNMMTFDLFLVKFFVLLLGKSIKDHQIACISINNKSQIFILILLYILITSRGHSSNINGLTFKLIRNEFDFFLQSFVLAIFLWHVFVICYQSNPDVI